MAAWFHLLLDEFPTVLKNQANVAQAPFRLNPLRILKDNGQINASKLAKLP
jgi:hypothetical protein